MIKIINAIKDALLLKRINGKYATQKHENISKANNLFL